jgi:2-oxoglutarate dehydrogenase E1 component
MASRDGPEMSNAYPEHIAMPNLSSSSSMQQGSVAPTMVSPLQITRFIDAHRHHGYRLARLDPLALAPVPVVPELAPRFHGLAQTTVRELEQRLKDVYCGAMGLDCSGVRSESRRQWLFAHMETEVLLAPATHEQRQRVLRRLVAR